ncbi:MAG: glycosyltransferase family 2 protein [Nitrososphaerota archaeon]
MNSLPMVDVLMPAYNHESFVEAAVESVLYQSYSNVRLITVDDCSTDNTARILRGYAERFPQKVIFTQNTLNMGIPATWNKCLRRSSAEFVVPFASDDLLPPAAVESRVRFMLENPEVDVLVTDFLVAGPDGVPVDEGAKLRLTPQFKRMYTANWSQIYEELLAGNFICGDAVTIRLGRVRREELLQDIRCPNLSDYDMWLRLGRLFRWEYIPVKTCVYRWHGLNRSSPKNPHNTEEVVWTQMIYILSKQLLSDQTDLQRERTIAMIHQLTVLLYQRLNERTMIVLSTSQPG